MPVQAVNIEEAGSHFSELVDDVAGGAEIIICKAGKRVARLMPLAGRKKSFRTPGGWEGKGWIAEDFDHIPEEFFEYLPEEP